MKYLIGNQCINADHIISVDFNQTHDGGQSDCYITLTSTEPATNYNGDQMDCSQSTVVILTGENADLFWQAYIGDAYTVVNP